MSVPPRVAALLAGTLSVEDLDDEELARGYPRSADGSFRGAPTVIPKIVHDRIVRELFKRADQKLKESLLDVVDTMVSIAQDGELDANVRLKAATYVYERLRGKVPEVVVTTDTKRWEEVLDGVYRGPRMQGDIIDAEIVDDGREP